MHEIDHFVQQWETKNKLIPVPKAKVDELELRLALVLPSAYKYLISKYGLLHTPNVLTKTCDLNVRVSEVHDFLNLEDVVSLSALYEMGGDATGTYFIRFGQWWEYVLL